MILPFALSVVGAVIGFVIAKAIENSKGKKLINSTKKEAAAILKEANVDAEALKKDKILQAKQIFRAKRSRLYAQVRFFRQERKRLK